MANGSSKEVKTVYLALLPGDRGPVCSYSPLCSPPSVYTNCYHEQTITVTESRLDVSKFNRERATMERWILQLVHRELAGFIEGAEKKLKLRLKISLDDASARVIQKAVALRVAKKR